MSTARSIHRHTVPGLLGRTVFDDIFDGFFSNPHDHLRRSTQGYPVADIFRDEHGNTILEFALAGFAKEDLTIEVKPEKRSISVSATSEGDTADTAHRRIARRAFTKTFVNYDDNLDLSLTDAEFENGLLVITIPQRPELKPQSIDIK